MTIEQIVEIPSDHRVVFEFFAPKEIPPGAARVQLKFTPVLDGQGESVPETGKNPASSRVSATPISDSLVGILSRAGDINLQELREERLTKKYQK